MAGIKPMELDGNYTLGIGWEVNRWLQLQALSVFLLTL